MDNIPTKISSEHKCNCCIGEENIELCELEKCNYPSVQHVSKKF